MLQIVTVVKRWSDVSKISFVAHSLGGLVARYAIGRLYENIPIIPSSGLKEKDTKNSEFERFSEVRIAGLQPVNFITVATPHLGSRGHRQVEFGYIVVSVIYCYKRSVFPAIYLWMGRFVSNILKVERIYFYCTQPAKLFNLRFKI